jgi:hypothetical protein
MGTYWVWARTLPGFTIKHITRPVKEEEGSGDFMGYSLCHTSERDYTLFGQFGEKPVDHVCGECMIALLAGVDPED